jgi:hypothetical protein
MSGANWVGLSEGPTLNMWVHLKAWDTPLVHYTSSHLLRNVSNCRKCIPYSEDWLLKQNSCKHYFVSITVRLRMWCRQIQVPTPILRVSASRRKECPLFNSAGESYEKSPARKISFVVFLQPFTPRQERTSQYEITFQEPHPTSCWRVCLSSSFFNIPALSIFTVIVVTFSLIYF